MLLDKTQGSSHSRRQMQLRFRSAYSGGCLLLTCLLASCMRFGYEPADELDDGLAVDGGSGGTLGDGGTAGDGGGGSFAGADGSSDSPAGSSVTSGGAGGAAGSDSGGATSTTAATSSDGGGATSTGGTTGTDAATSSGGAGTGSTATTGTGGSGGTSTGGTSTTGTGGSGGTSTGGTTAAGTGGGATTGTGGGATTGTGGGTSTTGSATTSATTGGGACAPAGTADYLGSFDADLEGFVVSGSGGPTLTWTGAVGDPDLGAMELNASSGGAMQVRNVTPPGDLSGRIMSANVYVAAGTAVDIILYVQSGSPAKWADGGTVTATVGQWYCLTLDLDNPVTTSASFDPTDVRVVGLDIQGSGDVQVYIDQFAY